MAAASEDQDDETVITSRTVGKRRGDSTLPIEEKVESLRVGLLAMIEAVSLFVKVTE